MLEVQTQKKERKKELPWSSSDETVGHRKNRSGIIKHKRKHKDSSFFLLHSNNTHFSILCPKQRVIEDEEEGVKKREQNIEDDIELYFLFVRHRVREREREGDRAGV